MDSHGFLIVFWWVFFFYFFGSFAFLVWAKCEEEKAPKHPDFLPKNLAAGPFLVLKKATKKGLEFLFWSFLDAFLKEGPMELSGCFFS